MKSVTFAAWTRSMTLPSAPPTMRASGAAVRQSPRGVRDSHTPSVPLMTPASRTKNQRCQPALSARKLNAAPVLKVSVQLRMPGITGCGVSAGCRAVSAHHLVNWSSAIITAASQSQDSALGLGRTVMRSKAIRDGSPRRRAARVVCWHGRSEPAAILALPRHVFHAAATDLGMRRVVTDIVSMLPATDALGRLADGGGDINLRPIEV